MSVNYKIGNDIRAAVAELNHDVWELTDEAGRQWWIIKVCGNLASPLPAQKPIPTPNKPTSRLMAEVVIEELSMLACTSNECAKVGVVPRGERVEVFGCLADHSWCEVSWSGVHGWCTGQSLRQLAVATVISEVIPVLPTPTVVPPEEGKITFVSYRDGSYGIDLINTDGTNLTHLIYGQGVYMSPTWSPDGQQIAFMRNDGDIYLISTDGSSLTRLTNHPSGSQFRFPEWSPDGQRIAFTSSLDGGGIFSINIDGGGLTQLTKNQPWDTALTWSPDSRKIAFHADFDGDSFPELYVINADGSGQEQLTIGSEPAWSPNGERIAFRSVPDGRNADIYIMNIDGSGLARLTDHPAWDTNPDWSPDGEQIAFSRAVGGSSEIWLMNADGTNQRKLTDGNQPAWRPTRRQ